MQYLLCLVWPTQNQRIIREMGLKWEEMGDKEIVAADGVRWRKDGVSLPYRNSVYGTYADRCMTWETDHYSERIRGIS